MAGPSGFGLNVPFSNEQFAACAGRLEANACVAGDPPVAGRCAQTFPPGRLACLPIGGAGAGRDEVELLPRTPIYVPADISFDGETFRRVGFRLKGNSTLLLTWRRGNDKLPFRLNFDGLEARFPETRDQTFFGFPNLTFPNKDLRTHRTCETRSSTTCSGKPVYRRRHGVHARLPRSRCGPVLSRPLHHGRDPGSADAASASSDPTTATSTSRTARARAGRSSIQDAFSKRTNKDRRGLDRHRGRDRGAAGSERADRGALAAGLEARFDVDGVPAMAGAQHDHRQRRRLRRRLGAQLLLVREPAPSGAASPGSRGITIWPCRRGFTLGRPPTAGYFSQQHAVELAAHQVPVGRPRVSRPPTVRYLENLLATVFEPGRVTATLRSEQARIARFVVGPEGEPFGRNLAGSAAQFDAALFGPTGLRLREQPRGRGATGPAEHSLRGHGW